MSPQPYCGADQLGRPPSEVILKKACFVVGLPMHTRTQKLSLVAINEKGFGAWTKGDPGTEPPIFSRMVPAAPYDQTHYLTRY